MNFQEIRTTLESHGLMVFTTQEFVLLFGMKRSVASVKLARYKAKGYLASPKKGIYYIVGGVHNLYTVANKMYYPSYISLNSALSKYNIIPETIYAITSVTTKATREFTDENYTFFYNKIKKSAYTGYIKDGDVLIAEPEKALVDHLYFVALGKRNQNDRLNLSHIDKQKVCYYADLFMSKRLTTLVRKMFP